MGEVTFIDVLEAKYNGTKQQLNEASLSRVYQHVQKAGGDGSFAIIGAYRVEASNEDNVKAAQELEVRVRGMGFGFFKLTGHWRECKDRSVPYSQCPPDQLVDAVEPSLFIPKISQEQAEQLLGEFQQNGIIYAGPETKGKVHLIMNDGSHHDLGEFHPDKVAQGYSQLRTGKHAGRSFKFEGFEYRAQSFMEGMCQLSYQRLHEVKEEIKKG